MKMNKQIPKKISVCVFFGFLVVVSLLTFLLPKESFSDIENRVLASFPKISWKNVKERKFMNGFESYIADHFFGRTDWIKAKTNIELAAGKKEINSVYILDNRLVEKLSKPNTDAVERSISAVNNFSSDTGLQTFVMIVPTSAAIYADKLPANAPNVDQKKDIENIYSQLSDEIVALDAYTTLSAESDEYIYYRTDHHWTSLGAYYTYAATIKKMGFNAIPWDSFNIEHASSAFLGTLYSKVLDDDIQSDTLDIYYPTGDTKITAVEVQNGKTVENYDSYYFRDYLSVKDKYSVFGGQNEPIVTIKTNSPGEQKLLVIKDSYANCYIPFLAQHYSEITMIDMRYIDTAYRNVIDIDDYNQALFLYNYSTFSQDDNLKKLDF